LLTLFKVLKKHWIVAKAVELTDVYELCIHSASQLSASVQKVSEEEHREVAILDIILVLP